MAIALTPETEERLRERATAEGQDIDTLADSILSAYLDGHLGALHPPVPSVADDDADALDALIAEADADFSAGRFRSLEAVMADKRQRFGIEL
jgi:hypothetical protein